MTPRLKELLERRRKPQGDTPKEQTQVQEVSEKETPAIILVPAWDYPTEDEFSPYF